MEWGMGCVPWVAEVKFAQQGGNTVGRKAVALS